MTYVIQVAKPSINQTHTERCQKCLEKKNPTVSFASESSWRSAVKSEVNRPMALGKEKKLSLAAELPHIGLKALRVTAGRAG